MRASLLSDSARVDRVSGPMLIPKRPLARLYRGPEPVTPEDVNARVWAGLHYRFSGVAGVLLGQKVADYDLKHAFQPMG